MKGKRGQGLSMNTIVIAVIVLFVMVILLLIFTGRIAIFSLGVRDCQNTGGQCSDNAQCTGTSIADLNGNGVLDIPTEVIVEKADDGTKIGCGTGVQYCCRGVPEAKKT